MGKPFCIMWSSSKPPQKKDFSLYVQNMPYSLGSEELGSLFSAFGEVTSATVITKKRRSMGYGFVTYSSLDDAVIATSVMNGYIIGNRPLRVAFSHSAEKTRQIEQPMPLPQLLCFRATHSGDSLLNK
uniref:RRM domain-containing protein n=1 Tax=Sinocyclocheilus anshuiensis TaxID=1608454 RepID=A0A671R3R1_9TELE